jgi:DnaJ-class molecular chaperone
MIDDPYAALGLTKTATPADIKKAYRKLVRTSHPDLHPDDPKAEGRFKIITAAHDLLKDPATRARFDAGEIDASGAERPPERAGRNFYRDYADAPGQSYPQGQRFEDFGDPSDIFTHILRQRAQSGTGQRGPFGDSDFSAPGQDLRFSLEVPFLEAVRGSKTRITLPGGENLDVQIPKGLNDGQTLRLRGRGGPGYGGAPAGDALVTVSVRPHPVFRREGDDIVLTLPISMDEAILGGKVAVPTIDGLVSLTIPKGATSGQILRLRGRGVHPQRAAKAGDQRVELRIATPPAIDADLQAFMENWRKTHGYDPRKAAFEGMPE